MALAAIEPTPTTDTTRRAIRVPKTANSAKLKNGIAGMTPVSWSTLPFHFAGAIGVKHAVLVIEAQEQRQADGDFGCRHGQNKKEHHLAVRLHPMRARRNECQPGGIEHDLNGHEREHEV